MLVHAFTRAIPRRRGAVGDPVRCYHEAASNSNLPAAQVA
ncbi:hypothetical protein SBRY_10098 [Actinacidiphila bryophytorum]|uniref:Uncharacterized protein n=1 Tax=Actinacidiphila bryophytorum TaxID=1436133 RepID=A0A9W4GVS8_9ACTN|nr:hypothetical protein SBRY_10098 [Actinacidiphila bryophytorum]